jgi:hypothetical protein
MTIRETKICDACGAIDEGQLTQPHLDITCDSVAGYSLGNLLGGLLPAEHICADCAASLKDTVREWARNEEEEK